MKRNDFNTMAIYSFRYCLGRRTYAVSEMVNLLIRRKDELSEFSIQLIRREIKDAIEHDRAGMQCDVNEWQRLFEATYGQHEAGCQHEWSYPVSGDVVRCAHCDYER